MNNLSHQDFLSAQLQNAEFATHYLHGYLEDGTPEEIAEAISKVIRALRDSDRPKIFDSLFQQNRDSLPLTGVS